MHLHCNNNLGRSNFRECEIKGLVYRLVTKRRILMSRLWVD